MNRTTTDGPVILVEDDDALREAMLQTLDLYGLSVQAFENAARAVRQIGASFTGCIVSDIRMDGMDGLQLFARVMEIDREIPIILISGHGDIAMAVRAMQDGAYDFIAKPFAADHLAAVVRRALHARQLVIENRSLRTALARPADAMNAPSQTMIQLYNLVTQVARTELDVLIEGETGTGKETLARQLHAQSARFSRPFNVISGAALALSPDMLPACERLDGSVLYLDGCDTLSQPAQAALVALLDARDRARAHDDTKGDFRLVASTLVPLPEILNRQALRGDLFHRLNAVTLRIPPLRERRDEIPVLFAKFVREALEQTGKKKFEMNASDRKKILEYDWPGNGRELRNYAFGAVLNLPRNDLQMNNGLIKKALPERLDDFERMVICEALHSTAGNVVRACALLGTPRKTLYEKLLRHAINPAQFRRAKPV